MRLGLHLNSYAGLGEPAAWGAGLARLARTAEDVGFARLSATDHLWQISLIGEEDEPMMEAYTLLAFLAGQTTTIELQTLVTAATYRAPGLLGKIISTLDVLSGGRTWLGIGTGWNEQEATGLGLPFDGIGGRYARLEETLQIVLQMFAGTRDSYRGQHYQLASTLNEPQPIGRPRVMVGGGGELRTLRLAATYADAINVYGGPDARQKVNTLRAHCDELGRDFASIEKTALLPFDISRADGAERLLGDLERLHALGFTTVYGYIRQIDPALVEDLGHHVISEVREW